MSGRFIRAALTLTTSVAVTLALIINAVPTAQADTPTGATLNGHPVMVDSSGKLASWIAGDQAYGTVSRLAWDYLLDSVPDDENGRPAYYSHSYLNPDAQQPVGWPHNPAGLYGMLIESAVRYYQYSGDARVLRVAQDVADYQLAHGMTAATASWANVPYASGDSGSTTYRGAAYGDATGSGDGTGVIEPDKLGEFGHGLVQLYKLTGNKAYLSAAQASADALVAHLRTGSATRSPWPFRVVAKTNQTRVEDYGANVAGNLDLFDDLIGLGSGDVSGYQKARSALWSWTMSYPMVTGNWSGYFEDVEFHADPSDNLNQLNAMMFARYLLLHPGSDKDWEAHVRSLITWTEKEFGESTIGGATAIREQKAFFYKMGSHTARYAEVNALLYEQTGDTAARDKVYRSFNWATYMTRSNGVVIDGPEVNNQWFTDGYGDYIRHFMIGMGAVPAWAPDSQTHVLETSSLIKAVSYGSAEVSYTTYDASGTEKIKTAQPPSVVRVDGSVLARSDGSPGWSYDSSSQVLTVRRTTGTTVDVTVGSDQTPTDPSNQPPSVKITAPSGGAHVTAGTPITITATATDADGVVDHVDLRVDGEVLASPTQQPYSATISTLSAGSHQVKATAVDDDKASTTSAAVSITVDPVSTPTVWRSADIGDVGVEGSDSVADGTVSVRASGTDIWGSADSFRFRYRALSDDGSVTARVLTQQASDPWALAGVMVRSTTSPGSPHVLLAATPGHGLSFDHRAVDGAETTYEDAGGADLPVWLRLTRSGSTVEAFSSADGLTWTKVGTVTIEFGAQVLAGLAVTSHDNDTLGTATFDQVAAGDSTAPVISAVSAGSVNVNGGSITWQTDEPSTSQIEYGLSTSYGSVTAENTSLITDHVQVVSGLAAATTYHYRVRSTDAAGNTAVSTDQTFTTGSSVPASDWTSRDIGAVGMAGSDVVAGGTVTLAAAGSDIWGSADSFRFRYRALDGDGSITARLVAQQAVDADSLAGVMIRSGTDADSPHVMLAVAPGSGLSFDHRGTRGGSTGYAAGGATEVPVWLRLTRSGTTVTAERSFDGSTWTTVADTSVDLGDQVLVGLAVTSHDNATLGSATFDSVTTGDLRAPAIDKITTDAVGVTTGTISWRTDEPATSQIEYGPTTSYGARTTTTTGLDRTHRRTLSTLVSASGYHYRVRSTDVAGNTSVSADRTFQTIAGVPPDPSGLPRAMEALAATPRPTSCDPRSRPGVERIGRLLTSYAGTTVRRTGTCPDVPATARDEGRALDWKVSARSPRQSRQAAALTGWLTGRDLSGQPAGRARRLGITSIEWKNTIWRADQMSRGWQPLGDCATHPELARDSGCRRDHLEVTLSWAGANARTSFWTAKVAKEEFGPCAPKDLSWAPSSASTRSSACPAHQPPKVPKGASKRHASVLRYSGMTLENGSAGKAVKIVQQVLGVKDDGIFTTRTEASLTVWQRRHQVKASGRMDAATWRAMLRTTAP